MKILIFLILNFGAITVFSQSFRDCKSEKIDLFAVFLNEIQPDPFATYAAIQIRQRRRGDGKVAECF